MSEEMPVSVHPYVKEEAMSRMNLYINSPSFFDVVFYFTDEIATEKAINTDK